MKLLLDMNMSPQLVGVFAATGIEAVHWSRVGSVQASDRTILGVARRDGYVVLTHDLDFGALLAMTRAAGPSVIQLRDQDLLSPAISGAVIQAVRQCADDLQRGAVLTIDAARFRVSLLPLSS